MLEKKIDEFAIKNNICIGICDALPLSLKNVREVPFVKADLEMRISPKRFFEEAESIIIFAVPYETLEEVPNSSEPYGKFAMGTMGTDYHIRLKNLVTAFIEYFSSYCEFRYKIHIDTGDLIEREFAKKAGLGFIGKNAMLINEQLGSCFNIAMLLVNVKLQPSQVKETIGCGDCNICEKACLGGAIKNYNFDYKNCVSYLTQKKEDLSIEEIEKLHKFIYGCDICQRVCKFNIGKFSKQEFRIDVETFLNLSNKEFKIEYGKTAIAWRGKKILQRNARACLKNNLDNFEL